MWSTVLTEVNSSILHRRIHYRAFSPLMASTWTIETFELPTAPQSTVPPLSRTFAATIQNVPTSTPWVKRKIHSPSKKYKQVTSRQVVMCWNVCNRRVHDAKWEVVDRLEQARQAPLLCFLLPRMKNRPNHLRWYPWCVLNPSDRYLFRREALLLELVVLVVLVVS